MSDNLWYYYYLSEVSQNYQVLFIIGHGLGHQFIISWCERFNMASGIRLRQFICLASSTNNKTTRNWMHTSDTYVNSLSLCLNYNRVNPVWPNDQPKINSIWVWEEFRWVSKKRAESIRKCRHHLLQANDKCSRYENEKEKKKHLFTTKIVDPMSNNKNA